MTIEELDSELRVAQERITVLTAALLTLSHVVGDVSEDVDNLKATLRGTLELLIRERR